jgi:hypothetical protein
VFINGYDQLNTVWLLDSDKILNKSGDQQPLQKRGDTEKPNE